MNQVYFEMRSLAAALHSHCPLLPEKLALPQQECLWDINSPSVYLAPLFISQVHSSWQGFN